MKEDMMKWRLLLLVLVVAAAVVASPVDALAGPGGKIASAAFQSFWGRVLLGLLAVVFLPLILYVVGREYIGSKRARRDLDALRRVNPAFDWMTLHDRVT